MANQSKSSDTHSNMSLGETRKRLQQSREIVDEADDNTNSSVLLNTILKLVSSIDDVLGSYTGY
jgi:hypothetical protein